MPRYKLRIPSAGAWLHGDGEEAVVAHTAEQARTLYRDERDEPDPVLVHSYIGRCRVLYARDIENGDGHEDAEAGDTTVDYLPDDGRVLADNEVRVWELGPPPVAWVMDPLPPAQINWQDIPIGMDARHAVLGDGVLVRARPWRASGRPLFTVRFEDGTEQDLLLGNVQFFYSVTWGGKFPPPPTEYRATVEGETLVERASEHVARLLIDLRVQRLNSEWAARQTAALVARS